MYTNVLFRPTQGCGYTPLHVETKDLSCLWVCATTDQRNKRLLLFRHDNKRLLLFRHNNKRLLLFRHDNYRIYLCAVTVLL